MSNDDQSIAEVLRAAGHPEAAEVVEQVHAGRAAADGTPVAPAVTVQRTAEERAQQRAEGFLREIDALRNENVVSMPIEGWL